MQNAECRIQNAEWNSEWTCLNSEFCILNSDYCAELETAFPSTVYVKKPIIISSHV